MVRTCSPPARKPATSWVSRRSTMATSTRANANSPANINPVGPPPATTTACSIIAALPSGLRRSLSTHHNSQPPRSPAVRTLAPACRVRAHYCFDPPRDPYTHHNTGRLHAHSFGLASVGNSEARPGSCRKPPGVRYIGSGRDWVGSFFDRPLWIDTLLDEAAPRTAVH